jgi:hypothetical protein
MSYANAPIVLNVRDRTAGPYNSAQFNATNQNIIQGDIREIAVSEVNFPYDIPNVQAGRTNFFEIYTAGDITGNPVLGITIPPGFYTGTELAAIVTTQMRAAGAAWTADPIEPANIPVCTYDATSNRFKFELVAPTQDPLTWGIASPYTYPVGELSVPANRLGKDIFSIMGFLPSQENGVPAVTFGYPFISGASAPLAFTQYVDICSPQLCKYQYFRDGSTTNLARRADVICRLYVCDNISNTVPDVEGTRPFILNRQFFNARIMRWSVDNSVGTIDMQLYDDTGEPLQITWEPRPYQITFNCYERSKEEDAEGREGGAPRYPSYQERNVSKAWSNLGRQ